MSLDLVELTTPTARLTVKIGGAPEHGLEVLGQGGDQPDQRLTFASLEEQNRALRELLRQLARQGFRPGREPAPRTEKRCADPALFDGRANTLDAEGRRTGVHRHVDSDGDLCEVTYDDQGLQNGPANVYRQTGLLFVEQPWEPAEMGQPRKGYGCAYGATHRSLHSLAFIDGSRRAGTRRVYDPEGAMTYQVGHVEGLAEGVAKVYRDGQLSGLSFSRVGALDGVAFEWDPDSETWTVTEYEDCLQVDRAAWKALAAQLIKLRKRTRHDEKYADKATAMLYTAAGKDLDDRNRLAWRLAKEKLVDAWSHIPYGLLLEPLGSTPELVARVVASVPEEDFFDTFWRRRLYRMVRFHAAHADAFNDEVVPAHARAHVRLALGQPARFSATELARFADHVVSTPDFSLERPSFEHGLFFWREEPIHQMAIDSPFWAAVAPAARLLPAILAAAQRKQNGWKAYASQVLYEASAPASGPELLELLPTMCLPCLGAYRFMQARRDDAGELLALATASTRDVHQQAIAMLAALRCRDAGQMLDPGFDRFLALTCYADDASARPQMRTLYLDALASLPAARAHALVAARLDLGDDPAIGEVAVAFAPELLERVKRRAEAAAALPPDQKPYGTLVRQVGILGGSGPVDRLQTLASWHDAATRPEERLLFARAIRVAMEERLIRRATGGAGSADGSPEGPWDARHDRFLDCSGFGPEGLDSSAVERMHVILAALPAPRLEGFLLRHISLSALPSVEGFRFLGLCPTPALLTHATGVLVDGLDRLVIDDASKSAVWSGFYGASLERVAPYLIAALGRCQRDRRLLRLLDVKAMGEIVPRIAAALRTEPAASVPPPPPADEPYFARLRRLIPAATAGVSGPRRRVALVHRLGTAPAPSDVSRASGRPIGVSRKRWPKYLGEPMEHVVTLDIGAINVLKNNQALEGYRAVALFLSDARFHEAWEAGTEHARVLLLTEDEVAQGELPLPAHAEVEPGEALGIEVVEIPEVLYGLEAAQLSAAQKELAAALQEGWAIADGPDFIQSDDQAPEDQAFLFQFDERHLDVNLGDCGAMYVYATTAFSQSH
jgi:hypothetical protein